MLLTQCICADLLIISASLVLLIYIFLTRNFNYWKKQGIPFIEPLPLFGTFKEVFLRKNNMSEALSEIYFKSKDPYVGLFVVDKPVLLINDRELIKSILVRDFSNFSDRSFGTREGDLSEYMLPFMKGKTWKTYRKFNTPAFSRATLKSVYFRTIQAAGQEAVEYLETTLKTSDLVNCKLLASMFTVEMLTCITLGVAPKCFRDEHSKYLKMGHGMFAVDKLKRDIAIASYLLYPSLVNMFKFNLVDPDSENYFRKVFFETIRRRKATASAEDLIDILLKWRHDNQFAKEYVELDDDKLVAQALAFFLAGHEGTTSVIAFTLYELAANPDVQERLRAEIKDYLHSSENNSLNFETLFSEMKYFDMVLKEVLRKYPPVSMMDRRCLNDYKIPGSSHIIKGGTTLFIPSLAVHRDPQYWLNPEKFDPERFTEENMRDIVPGTYFPFGDGPRVCIGEKIGQISVKLCVARIIERYQIELRDDTQKIMKIPVRAQTLIPEDDVVMLRFKKL
nr:cytochrome P450 [Agasicles hygrophila]